MPPHSPLRTALLGDRRRIAYAEYGSPDGHPLLYCHGYPMSRLEAEALDKPAKRLNIRVIAPDRPGFGHSSPQYGRNIFDWSCDMRVFLYDLRVESLHVLGTSGGGPYAIACGRIPGAKGVKLLAPAPPFQAGIRYVPWLSLVTWQAARWMPRGLEKLLDGLVAVSKWTLNTTYVKAKVEKWLEAQPSEAPATERREKLYVNLLEGFVQGSRATVDEALLLAGDWDLRLDHMLAPIEIWHGTKDARAPIEMIRWMTEWLPNCTLHEFEGGHVDMDTQIEEILQKIANEAKI